MLSDAVVIGALRVKPKKAVIRRHTETGLSLSCSKVCHASLTMDGWMTCDFKSFSTVFQSYQDNGWMMTKSCVQWNPGYS